MQEKVQEKSSSDDELKEKKGVLSKSKQGDLVDFVPPIKVAKRVVLVRHGQSSWNAEGRIQGSSDFSVLTQKGEAQAETSRQMLIDDSFDVCFSRFSSFCSTIFCNLFLLSLISAGIKNLRIYC